jgi:cobalt-zinc-cadmium efflux system protein
MAHTHDHGSQSYTRAFAIGVGLNLAYVAVELTYGLIGGSLALISDAGHSLSDVLGLLLAWGATWLVRRRPSPRRSYGFRRSSVLAALFNALFLLVAVGVIAWEAIQRLANPEPVAGVTVMVVAAVGIVVNGVTAWLFMSGQKGDVNIRGAFLHMAADAAVSLGVVLSGLVILLTGWDWLDPVTSLVIVVVIVFGTWGLLRESVDLALDAVPEGIDPAKVEAYLAAITGVREVHDLHIWGMSTTETALTAHLVIPDGGQGDGLLRRVCEGLHDEFGIEHVTIQIEHGDSAHPCPLAPARVV